MTTIPIDVSTEQLVRAVEQLPQQELEIFVAQIVALRAQRTAPHLSQEETVLLLQIKAPSRPICNAASTSWSPSGKWRPLPRPSSRS